MSQRNEPQRSLKRSCIHDGVDTSHKGEGGKPAASSASRRGDAKELGVGAEDDGGAGERKIFRHEGHQDAGMLERCASYWGSEPAMDVGGSVFRRLDVTVLSIHVHKKVKQSVRLLFTKRLHLTTVS